MWAWGNKLLYFKFKRAEPPVQIFPSCLELIRFYRKVASLTNDEYQYKDGAKLDYAWRKVEENDAETISEISDIEERAFMLFQGI